MYRKVRKCRKRGGVVKRVSNNWFNKSRIWLPSSRGGNLLRRVYKKMKRGKGYTRADLVGITDCW